MNSLQIQLAKLPIKTHDYRSTEAVESAVKAVKRTSKHGANVELLNSLNMFSFTHDTFYSETVVKDVFPVEESKLPGDMLIDWVVMTEFDYQHHLIAGIPKLPLMTALVQSGDNVIFPVADLITLVQIQNELGTQLDLSYNRRLGRIRVTQSIEVSVYNRRVGV